MWLQYFQRYRGQYRWLVFSFFLSVLQSLLVLPAAWAVATVFDRAIPASDFQQLLAISAALLVLSATSSALALINRYVTLRSTKIVTRGLREDLFRKLYSFSRNFYDKGDRNRLHSVIVQDSERVDFMSNALVSQMLPSMFTAVLIGLVLLYLNSTLAIVLIALLPLVVLTNRWFQPALKSSVDRFRKSFDTFSSGVLFVVDTIDLARVQSAEQSELARQDKALEDLRIKSGRVAWLQTAYSLAQNSVSIVGSVAILAGGGYAVANGTMTLGELMSFYVVVGLLRSRATTIAAAVPLVVLGVQALKSLNLLLDQEDPHDYRGRGRISPTGAFELRNVCFDYEREPVLTDASLLLLPGQHVAIVGPNGSGKSTIIHLLCGFYRPRKGSLFADKMSYDDLDIVELRRSLAVVQQEPTFFSGSILENVAYGANAPDIDRAREACRVATAQDFVESLTDGYQTQIGDKGVRLSGGQRQRLAIARALYRTPMLLILDEPTNHLDVDSISRFLENLKQQDTGPTTLIVSHDYRVVAQADQVYGLEAGQLSELRAEELAHWVKLLGDRVDPEASPEQEMGHER
ncbi:MAG: ABC transporter ATP-binding protein [Acidobacteria bacterium]|nr:ABC transporter ATP-binding protein [Acidobacteriota bacterium]MDA1234840.1 ABC transporter ATP-binding protein [Acidobacteriota bacterium]